MGVPGESVFCVERGARVRRMAVCLVFIAATATPLVAVGSVASAAPVGVITAYADGLDTPTWMTAGPDGNLWFTNRGRVGRVTTTGVITFFTPGTTYDLQSITTGPDGNLWLTDLFNDAIVRMTTAGVFTTFSGPATGISAPLGITTGSDGNLWFTNSYRFAPSIGRITTAGVVTTFTDPKITRPQKIAAGPDGNLWFSDTDGQSPGSIERITTAGAVTQFAGTGIDVPRAIVAGPDGNLWFANSGLTGSGSIGRITTGGVATSFASSSIDYPTGLAAGPDGNVWYTNYSDSIGQISPAGVAAKVTAVGVSRPMGIAAGADGKLWFANSTNNSLGSVTTAGVFANYTGSGVSAPQEMTYGPDGNLWFTNSGSSSIGRITPAGVATIFKDPLINNPAAIAAGPDGTVWFTNGGSGQIARITPAGAVSAVSGTGLGYLPGISLGWDGNMWFTNNGGNSIGRITAAGVVTMFPGVGISQPQAITRGSDGALWFTNFGNSSLGRITSTGVVTNFSAPGFGELFALVTGPDGNLWFTSGATNEIVRMTTAGVVTPFTAASLSHPRGIASGTDGNLWFVNWANNMIGRITLDGVISSYTDVSVSSPWGIVAGPDGGMWFSNSFHNSIGRITASGDPDAPTGVVGVPGNGQVTVSWTAPNANGPPITQYTVTASPGGAKCTWTTGPLSCVVTGLTNNTPYTFTVKAKNALGTGLASAPSAPVTPAVQLPGAPTGAAAVASNASATVSWAAPLSNGGAPITSYKVTATPGGATCTWTTGPLSCAVAGLSNGTAYTFRVTATNSAGTGPPSVPSAAVTPKTVPGAPSGVNAVAGNTQATVSWVAPASTGGAPITTYQVTANPGGATCTWTAGPLSCVVSGLPNGTPATFTVRATNSVGAGAPSPPSSPVTPVSGTYFHPLAPVRILDSRGTVGGWNAKLAAGTPKNLVVTGGSGGVPADVDAVVLNVTATGGSANSFLTAYPAGGSVPITSNVNFAVGQTIPNLVTVKVGPGGQVAFANALGSVDVIVDLVGYFGSVPADRYNALTPVRILDSRGANGGWNAKLVAGSPKTLQVRGVGSVPATADAVIVNVTVTGGTANSFVTVYPAGAAVPTASNVNFAVGETIPNLVTVKIGAGGQVAFANAVGAVDVIADVVGYFDPSTGDVFHSLTPARILDSRGPTGGWNAKLAAGSPRALQVTGAGNVGATATAVIANTTVTGATANSFVTVYPAGAPRPTASNLNFAAGQTIPNLVAVKIGTAGQVSFANEVGATDVLFDVVGYFTAT